jgi:signal transduction histidine kinase
MRNSFAIGNHGRRDDAGSTPAGTESELTRWYRWGWIPLVAGCGVIVVLAMWASELYLGWSGHELDPELRHRLVARGVVVSFLLAAYAGWFVWRSRHRLERARERLRSASHELRERERRVDQRVAMEAATRVLAHEIRNPLNNMLLNCTVLERALRRLPPDDAERVRKVCDVLHNEIERLSKLSAGYLAGGNTGLHPQELLLEDLADDVVDVYRPTIDARGLSVEVKGAGTTISADPDRLRQLLHNLIKNAIEAVPDHGQVAIECARQDGEVVLTVSDNGPGFSDLKRAFQLFHTTKAHGTGLGLAVVADIARMHGGRAEAANAERGGARLTISLPAAART